MKITGIEYFRLDLDMISGYTIAYETISQASNIILKINTSTGLTGWGCAAPDKEITQETPEEVIDNIEALVIPLLEGENPFHIARFHKELKAADPGMRSTLAMVNIALYDLMARKADLPLYQLLGGFRQEIQTSMTLGIEPLDDTLKKAKAYWQQGFRILKLKGGISIDEDVEKVRRLREAFGPALVLRFDANQGYNLKDAVRFIELTRMSGIELFEQPTAYGNDEALKNVTNNVAVPVMADESIRSLRDVFHISKNDISDMINIKIMKVGGLTESMHINSVAKAAGMEVMVGCLDECALGISAGLHFALSRPNVEFADLDGHLDFSNDPFKNLFSLKNGVMKPSDVAGLGRIKL